MLRLFVYNISYVMDNVQFFIFLQVILLSVPLSLQQQNSIPLSWTWSQWAEQISHHRIIRLTELIVRDVTYKLRHAEKLQEQHKHSITFELGSIAAGILDHFKVMLGVYRYYSDGIAFMKKYYDTLQYMDCFHRILLFDNASAFQNFTGNKTFHDPSELGVDISRLTLATYLSLVNDSTGNTRDNNYIANAEEQTRRFGSEMFPYTAWGNDRAVVYSCYYIHSLYRNALFEIHRYFWRRTLYKSTLEYEVGYLAHEIVWRYRTVLELYHYLVHWYEQYPIKNYAPTVLIFYFYTNVLQQCTTIIHLCNMLHELEKKYRMPREYGVFDDYESKKEGASKDKQRPKHNTTFIDESMAAYEAYLRKLKQDAKRKKKEEKERRKAVLKLGQTTTRGRPTPKQKRRWPLHYGWSIEDW